MKLKAILEIQTVFIVQIKGHNEYIFDFQKSCCIPSRQGFKNFDTFCYTFDIKRNLA